MEKNKITHIKNLLQEKDRHYSTYPIPKSSGKLRWLEIPDKELRTIQREILTNILYRFRPPDIVYSYRKRLSVKNVAEVHKGAMSWLKLDIRDFFFHIKLSVILNFFQQHQRIIRTVWPQELSLEELSYLLTYKQHLPQGAPTSPALSNIVCYGMDASLSKFAAVRKQQVTRYSDDIVFSDQNSIIQKHEKAQVKSVIRRFGFWVNDEKTRIIKRGQRMLVNGIVVNEKLNIPKNKTKILRATLHNLKGKEISRKEYQILRGKIEWMKTVNPEKAQAFLKSLGEIKLESPET